MLRPAAILGGLAALAGAATTPASPEPFASWAGFYAGVHAGYARGKTAFDAGDLANAGITSPTSASGLTSNGAALGFGGGFNWQAGALVLGIEGDWSHTSLRTDIAFAGTIAPFGAVTGTLASDLDWMASARARAGIAVSRALLFGTAGLSVARATGELAIFGAGAPVLSDRILLAGWSIGGGIEYALSPTWSVKGELIRTHFGTDLFSSASASVPLSSQLDVYNLRAGLNFRF